jgi:hypothetical protein
MKNEISENMDSAGHAGEMKPKRWLNAQFAGQMKVTKDGSQLSSAAGTVRESGAGVESFFVSVF